MVHTPHLYFPAEPDDTVLWRYVDLYRLLDLLRTSELHLTRADSMEDKWEGAASAASIANRRELYGDNYELVSRTLPAALIYGRSHTYLSCWYIGREESYAMWRLYGSEGKGVALRTTAGRLHSSLSGANEILATRVNYVDYATTPVPEGNLFAPYTYKRLSFQHEREYRLVTTWHPAVVDERAGEVIRAPDVPPPFLRESVVLDFIDSIYVSPDAPRWAAVAVTDAVARYLPNVLVRHSDLGADPLY